MANLNAQLAGANLQLIDNATSVQRVNSPVATIVAQLAAAFYDPYFLVTNGAPTSVTLPGATVWNISIKNLSGTNTVSIVLTPTGGAAWASPYVLVPNGIFLTMATFASNPGTGGFTALSLGSSGANTFAEVYLAA